MWCNVVQCDEIVSVYIVHCAGKVAVLHKIGEFCGQICGVETFDPCRPRQPSSQRARFCAVPAVGSQAIREDRYDP